MVINKMYSHLCYSTRTGLKAYPYEFYVISIVVGQTFRFVRLDKLINV
jgi:hypothetical protein